MKFLRDVGLQNEPDRRAGVSRFGFDEGRERDPGGLASLGSRGEEGQHGQTHAGQISPKCGCWCHLILVARGAPPPRSGARRLTTATPTRLPRWGPGTSREAQGCVPGVLILARSLLRR